jgi:hypothetical protein
MENSKAVREQWLSKVAKALEPKFKALGYELPAYRMSCGFPSTGRRSQRIGECWAAQCSNDQTHEIFIHPSCADSVEVAAILAHEMTHAAVGLDKKHGSVFAKVARGMGLTGKMTATVAGEEFKKLIKPVIERLGMYPHAALVSGVSSRGPKQTTRLHKAACDECGYTVRVTSKWVDLAAPVCPNTECDNFQGDMTVE